VRGAWADIDVQLKRRADLVGNLVETVKGYATHEERTLSEVTRWRSATVTAPDPQARTTAENGLTQALRSLTLHTLLPWAIALGVTDAWLSRFAGRTVAPNDWYTAPKPVGVAELGGEIKQLHTLLRPRGR
jgi:hypothetical protein